MTPPEIITPKCQVCDNPQASVGGFSARDACVIDCPRCGKFAMTRAMSFDINNVPKEERMGLSSLLRERATLSLLPIMLSSETPENQTDLNRDGFHGAGWKELIAREFPRTISEKFDRSLRNLSRRAGPGKWVSQTQDDESLYYAEDDDVREFIVKSLQDDGLIERQRSGPASPVRLTARGWNRIADLERGAAALQYRQAFVAMWFNPAMAGGLHAWH